MNEKLLKKVSKLDFTHHKDFMVQQNRETKNQCERAEQEVVQLRETFDRMDQIFCTKVQFSDLFQIVADLK